MGGFIRPKKPAPIVRVQKEAVKAAPAGPTLAELDQRQRKITGRRGRRATILTSTQGVDEDITLGYKKLLN
jgi:hypothetical protein